MDPTATVDLKEIEKNFLPCGGRKLKFLWRRAHRDLTFHHDETRSCGFPVFQKLNDGDAVSLPMIISAGTETRVFSRIVNAASVGIIGDSFRIRQTETGIRDLSLQTSRVISGGGTTLARAGMNYGECIALLHLRPSRSDSTVAIGEVWTQGRGLSKWKPAVFLRAVLICKPGGLRNRKR